MSVKPYTIAVPDDALKRLSQLLSLAAFPDQLESDNQWDVGAPSSDIKRLVKYWRDGFNWRKAEAQLNKLPNFKTPVQVDGFGDVDVHCKPSPLRDRASAFDDVQTSRAPDQSRERGYSASVFPWM